MNTQCGICGLLVINSQYVGDVIGGICQGHTYPPYPIISRPIVISADPIPHTCSPDKALMRVVEKTSEDAFLVDKEYIQTICPCGKVLSSNEIKE